MKVRFTTSTVVDAPDIETARVRYDDIVWRHHGHTHVAHLHREVHTQIEVLPDEPKEAT
jgi:hypothetical protein